MSRVDTLTAYKCRFNYLQRNNPLFEKQKEEIKAGKNPEYSFSDFICTYLTYTENLAIGENADRAIILSKDNITERNNEEVRSWNLVPIVGKQGKPITVIKKSSGKKYDFNSDAVALYY